MFFETLCTIAVAAWNTKKILLGPSVTETFRILGIGAGEVENITPYGIEWDKPVSRLEESIKIIRLLWENDKKVDFGGKFWKLKDAIFNSECA